MIVGTRLTFKLTSRLTSAVWPIRAQASGHVFLGAGGYVCKRSKVNLTCLMLIYIKAVCLPAGVGALGDITTQLQLDDVHSRKKNIY